jgi:glucokinase
MSDLLADIGGTNTRLAMSGADNALSQIAVYKNAEHDCFESVLQTYLTSTGCECETLMLAVAGPVRRGVTRMTNLDWNISAASLSRKFNVPDVHMFNDFEALAWSTLVLNKNSLQSIAAGTKRDDDGPATRVVLGSGTGLGVSALVPHDDNWLAIAGEGGHVSMPAMSSAEYKLVDSVIAELGDCSAERLLSGAGLMRICRFFGGSISAPEEVALNARSGDVAALRAIEMFSAMLGTIAGDIALTFAARAGVYIGGGIVPALGDLFRSDVFMARFTQKGYFSPFLKSIPIHVITAPYPTLLGLSYCAGVRK